MSSQTEENNGRSVKGFWTGEMIKAARARLFDLPRDDAVDCAAYTLRMGAEVYISPTDDDTDAKNKTVRTLAHGESFTIPPGQFAFLLTEEIVFVPSDVMAFISMKAKVKWRGLINVSGFHADPGFKGRLVFAVFNAGPVVVHLRRGDDLFLIWFADLKEPTKIAREKAVQEHITSDMINGISGDLQSLPGLNAKIRNVEKSLSDRMHTIEKTQETLNTKSTIVITLLGTLVIGVLLAIVKVWLTPGAANSVSSATGAVGQNPSPTISQTVVIPGGATKTAPPTTRVPDSQGGTTGQSNPPDAGQKSAVQANGPRPPPRR